MEAADTQIPVEDITEVTDPSANLAQNLPGMMGQSIQKEAIQATAELTKDLPATIPVQTGGVDANQALKTAQSGFDCITKIFACFGGEGMQVPVEEPPTE